MVGWWHKAGDAHAADGQTQEEGLRTGASPGLCALGALVLILPLPLPALPSSPRCVTPPVPPFLVLSCFIICLYCLLPQAYLLLSHFHPSLSFPYGFLPLPPQELGLSESQSLSAACLSQWSLSLSSCLLPPS